MHGPTGSTGLMKRIDQVSGPVSAGSALFALLASSCCVLPILLVQAGMASSLVARLAWFDRYQDIFFILALVALMVSAIVSLINGVASKILFVWWGVGVVFLATAWILPQYEFVLQRWLLDMFWS